MVADVAVKEPGRQAIWMKLVDATESRKRAFVLGTAATALTLVGSFLNFLNYNAYPVTSAEALLVLGAMLALSVIVGLSAACLGVFGQMLLPWLLVVLAIELNFGGTLLVAGIIGSVLLARFARQALILWFGIVAASQLWIAFTGPSQSGQALASQPIQAAPAATAKPEIALVHLILDEHIGLEGIPDIAPRGPEMREQLRTFYVSHGFRVLAGAYSESLHTVNSIPRLLGLHPEQPWGKGGLEGTTVEQNPYFDVLQSMGFRIAVAQSDWLDYCKHPAVETCLTRGSGDLIDVGDQLPVSDKATILVFRFAALSNFARNVLKLYDRAASQAQQAHVNLPYVQLVQETATSTLSGMANFDWVIGQARSLPPGQALFAHLLVPHYPYVYDAQCGVRRQVEWRGRSSAVPWDSRYEAYFGQVECVTRKIEELLSAVASSPAAGKTVVILHGDHGSRIMQFDPVLENEGRFTDRDLVDGLAAFFAVSGPQIEPGYDTGRYPLRLILDALARSEFRTATPALPAGFVHTMQIEDKQWHPRAERSVDDKDWWQGTEAD